MRRSRSQRGQGQVGCLFGLILLLIAGFIAAKVIPVKVKAAELRQEVYDQARSGGTRDDGRIMAAILRRAEDNKLPVTEDNVKIKRSQGTISIDVTYTVPIEFPGYTYNWDFHHHAENPLF